MIHTAALWDVLGLLDALPPWWPPVSYVLAGAGVAAASLAVLFDILGTRRPRGPGAAPPPTGRARAGGQLAAAGILLTAWVLRGDAEIPPDAPLVAAEVVAAVIYAIVSVRRR